jgi:tRNA nucleotidyltransferase (CCA-adding enzyme)
MLGAEKPSTGLRLAQRTGLLWKVLPELEASYGHAQNRWHKFDVFEHTLVTVDNTEGDAMRRMGALLHDVGKPATAESAYAPGMFSFHAHDAVGADIAQDIVDRLKFSNDEKARLIGMVRHHMFGYGPGTTKKAIRRMVQRCGQDLIPDLIALRMGDIVGKGLGEDPEEKLPNIRERIAEVIHDIEHGTAAVKTNQLAISGHDVMKELGIKPGKQVGDVLRMLLERVIENPELNEREALLLLLPQIEC